MRIGPAEIEKDLFFWKFSLVHENQHYFPDWFSFQAMSRIEAARKYEAFLRGTVSHKSKCWPLVDQLRNALIFLEAEEE